MNSDDSNLDTRESSSTPNELIWHAASQIHTRYATNRTAACKFYKAKVEVDLGRQIIKIYDPLKLDKTKGVFQERNGDERWYLKQLSRTPEAISSDVQSHAESSEASISAVQTHPGAPGASTSTMKLNAGKNFVLI